MNTPSIEDYLKAIFKVGEESNVTARDIAKEVGVSAPAVSKMLKRLVDLKLVRVHQSTGIHLTPFGRKTALQTIRRHRLIESFLVRELGYKWDEVHDEAEQLEHYISPLLEERIAEKLGQPKFDPHGDPIPTIDGFIQATEEISLSTVQEHSTFLITRLSDRDPKLLRYAAELNLLPGTEIEFVRQQPFGGSFDLIMDGKALALPPEAAQHIFGQVISQIEQKESEEK